MTQTATSADGKYEDDLNRFVDSIYDKAWNELGWNWEMLASKSCLGLSTVYRLGNRITKWPRLYTVWKLSQAVGMPLSLSEVKRKLTLKKVG